MKNTMPTSFDTTVSQAVKGKKGLHDYGAVLEMKYNTEILLGADLDALLKADGEYQLAKSARIAQTTALNDAVAKAVALITVSRDNLKPKFGARYSRVWDKAGFRNGTLKLPRRMDAYLGHLKTLESLYEAEPDLETADVATKAILTAAADEFSAATEAASAAWVLQRQKREARDAAMTAMRVRLQSLFRELKEVLPKTDPRWRAFGFNVPGDVSVPMAPEGLTVTPGIPGHVGTNWDHSAGADRYRIFREVVGIDTKPQAVDTTTETSLDLGGMTSGARVRFYVIAANEAGESLPSATVEIVVP